MYRSTASLMISRADLEATLEPWITNALRGRGAPPQSQGCSVQDLMSAPVVRLISRMVEPPEPMMKPAARRVTLRMICLQVERLQPPDESACRRLWPESFCWAILHTSSENSCSLLSKSRRPDVATHPFPILSSSTIPCSSFSTPCPRCLGPEGWIQALGGQDEPMGHQNCRIAIIGLLGECKCRQTALGLEAQGCWLRNARTRLSEQMRRLHGRVDLFQKQCCEGGLK